jgi:hypothetical protein
VVTGVVAPTVPAALAAPVPVVPRPGRAVRLVTAHDRNERPPLLPGSIGASVRTTSGIANPLGVDIERFAPLTMPEVIEPPSPSGLPSAATGRPGEGFAVATGSGRTASGRSSTSTTARSV